MRFYLTILIILTVFSNFAQGSSGICSAPEISPEVFRELCKCNLDKIPVEEFEKRFGINTGLPKNVQYDFYGVKYLTTVYLAPVLKQHTSDLEQVLEAWLVEDVRRIELYSTPSNNLSHCAYEAKMGCEGLRYWRIIELSFKVAHFGSRPIGD